MAAITLDVWRQQRSVLAGKLTNSAYVILTITNPVTGLSFKHLCDDENNYKIDITDIVRVYGQGAKIEAAFYDSSDTELQTDVYTVNVKGNIDPARDVIPYNDSAEFLKMLYKAWAEGVIMPPQMIITPIYFDGLFETFDPARVGKQAAAFRVLKDWVGEEPYSQPIAIGPHTDIEIIANPVSVGYSFSGWADAGGGVYTYPMQLSTGRIVEIYYGSELVFNNFCSLNVQRTAVFEMPELPVQVSIVIKDSIGGDTILPAIRPIIIQDPKEGRIYRGTLNIKLDGTNVKVSQFECNEEVAQPIWRAQLRPLDCDMRYALVEWISRSGVKKRATWEVSQVADEQAEAQEIIDIQNAYDIRMGLLQKMTLRLRDLNAYDLWYYSDIVTSPDVRVAVNESDFDMTADEIRTSARVAITTKSVKQKDGEGGAWNTLTVEIKYRRYDAV